MSWDSFPTWELMTSSADSNITTSSDDSTVIMDSENSLVITDNPYFIVTASESNDLIVAEGIGPRGESYVGIRKDPTYSYDTDGNLVLVEYPDGSYKAFTYTNSVLTRIDYLLDGEIGTRLFIYSGDTLQRIEDN